MSRHSVRGFPLAGVEAMAQQEASPRGEGQLERQAMRLRHAPVRGHFWPIQDGRTRRVQTQAVWPMREGGFALTASENARTTHTLMTP